MKLLSLFDGSGGFPLAGSMCGITPVACSEIEPYPIAVTCSRFPNMKHYLDVQKVSGYDVEPVDIITFGSPCQDMSVAGKRAGLKHTDNGDDETTRSGLFMEAVRIIKEMREKTNGIYPRFAVWENVPGSFSSNGGEDFHCVLEEMCKISEAAAVMPPVPKGGWPYADLYTGDGWSVAYRILDAQYWGVPQRRKRIYLVADFASERAGEILFKRDGLRGNPAQSGTEGKSVAADAQGGTGTSDFIGAYQNTGICWWNESDVAETIRTPCGGDSTKANIAVFSIDPLSSNSMKSSNPHSGFHETEVAKCLDTSDGNPSKNQGGMVVCEALPFDTTQVTSPQNGNNPKFGDPCHSLAAGGHPPTVIANVAGFKHKASPSAGNIGFVVDKSPTLIAGQESAVVYDCRGNGDGNLVPTLTGDHQNRVTDYSSVVCIPINDKATRYKGGGESRNHDGSGNGLGVGKLGDPAPTLTNGDRHGVCYQCTYQDTTGPLMANSHPGSYSGQDAYQDMFVCGVDCRNGGLNEELCGTLQAHQSGGYSLNCTHPIIINYHPKYIVRRLTPTECARLQGFPDWWAGIEQLNALSDDEAAFWQEVQDTNNRINGKKVKKCTKDQIIRWHNGLHTDSAEYKMWGNGIALPCALYVMQGIAEVLGE